MKSTEMKIPLMEDELQDVGYIVTNNSFNKKL